MFAELRLECGGRGFVARGKICVDVTDFAHAGMMVLTSGLFRMKRSAISGMESPRERVV